MKGIINLLQKVNNSTQTNLTGILSSGFEEAPEILLLVEHVLCPFVYTVSQGKVGILQELLTGVDNDLLSVASNPGHPGGILHPNVVHDEPQHQSQQLVHVLTCHQ